MILINQKSVKSLAPNRTPDPNQPVTFIIEINGVHRNGDVKRGGSGCWGDGAELASGCSCCALLQVISDEFQSAKGVWTTPRAYSALLGTDHQGLGYDVLNEVPTGVPVLGSPALPVGSSR